MKNSYNEKNKGLGKTSRTIDFSRFSDASATGMTDAVRRDRQGRVIVPLYSDFFSSLSENVMCSNAMFNRLKDEIEDSLCVYPTNEQILLSVYVSSASADDSTRESVLVGFKKYIMQYLKRNVSALKRSFVTFLSLALFGILIEFLNYNVFSDALPAWVCNLIDVSATVLIWQFVAYLAFEFSKERRNIQRLRQILQIEYVFRHWE